MSLATLKGKVEQLIEKAQNAGGLPDWNDDSPIVCSGKGYIGRGEWELTEKGTLRWKERVSEYALFAASNSLNVWSAQQPAIIPFLTKVKQIYIPDGVAQTEFCFMPNCERVRMPDTISRKTVQAGMINLKVLDLSADIYATLADYYCSTMSGLEKVTLSPLTTTIPQACFNANYSLKEINLENITVFKNVCFQSDFNLSAPVVFNSGLVSIGNQAFQYTSIPSITFQNSLDSLPTIATNSFSGCNFLKNIYVPWAEGAVANAPWGATNATIHYNSEV